MLAFRKRPVLRYVQKRNMSSVKSKLLICNGTLCSPSSIQEKVAVFVEGDTIKEVGPTEEVKRKVYSENRDHVVELDAGGKLIMPGFICAHGHFYGMFARGMALNSLPPTNFKEILERLWWKLDRGLLEDHIAASTQVFLLDAIKSGCTTIIDHHSSPNFTLGSLQAISQATLSAGVRASLAYEVTDRNGFLKMEEGIQENITFIDKVMTESNPLLTGSFGLHASFTLSDQTLEACVSAIDKIRNKHPSKPIGFHVHVAEDLLDETHSLENYRKRTVHRLHKAGILGENSIAGHCTHIDDSEVDILATTKTKVVHNPQSNMNNAVGLPPLLDMLKKGVLVGLGTDGMTYDMIQEYKAMYIGHKHHLRDPRVMGQECYDLLLQNNGNIVSHFFQRNIGKIEPNYVADIILVDYIPPTPMHPGNLPWHIMFGFNGSLVDTTIVAGKMLMKGRRILTMEDEHKIKKRSLELAPKLWDTVKRL